MALLPRIFSSIQTGFRLMSETTHLSRNFHTIMRAIPSTPQMVPDAITPLPLSPVGMRKLLAPFQTIYMQAAGFKVKGNLKRRCKDCYFVIRQQRHYVICPTHPRHKQMSMKKREYKTWILTHATQSKVRPY